MARTRTVAKSAIIFITLLSIHSCFDGVDEVGSNSSIGKKRIDSDREKNGKKAALAALRAMSTEQCDWKVNPISLMRGEPCGKYYKILGLSRHEADPTTIKKKYREKSKILHPDKNPSSEAHKAFTSLTEGYSCLLDESCRNEYDDILGQIQAEIAMQRVETLNHASMKVKEMTMKLKAYISKAHYYITYGASTVDQGGHEVIMHVNHVMF
jgi:hypothetical protein